MDERVKGAVAHAVMEAGAHLRGANGGRKGIYEIERKCRDLMLGAFRKADPSLSMWNEGDERGVSICALDATVNFSNGFGGYGTMAAYIEGSVPVYGAIYLPLQETTITAEAGKGARIEGRKTSVGMRSDITSALVCCNCDAFLNDGGGDLPLFLAAVDALSRAAVPWRNIGSPATAYAFLAMGIVDGVVEPLRQVNHAAGYLIAREAGAKVTDCRGRPFHMGSHEVVAAGPSIHGELLELVGRALR